MPWGYHLILDCKSGKNVDDRNTIYNFNSQLVPHIGMEAWGEPIIERFDAPTPEEGGYTLVQIILTSTITGHFIDRSGDFYLDIFSCKPFESSNVTSMVEKYFQPELIKQEFRYRNAR